MTTWSIHTSDNTSKCQCEADQKIRCGGAISSSWIEGCAVYYDGS